MPWIDHPACQDQPVSIARLIPMTTYLFERSER